MKKPLVVHVIHSLATGGLENGVVNLVNGGSAALSHAIVCLTTDGPLRARVHGDVDVVALGKRPGNDVRAFVRLVALLRRMRPLVVHSRNWPAFDAIFAARLARVPCVVHGEHGRESTDPEGRNRRRNRMRRVAVHVVDRFATVSHDLARWLVRDVGIPASKVTRIVNGVDTDRFAPADRLAARRALGLAGDATIVGTVGRLDPVKDQAGLVRAFARAPAGANGDATLVIVGDGPCREDIESVVTELGLGPRVKLLGESQDVATVLAALDVFALPSIAEGISNTILEAMASGLPVVATRVGGNPELVDDGLTGTLVPARDEVALGDALAAYVDDHHLAAVRGKAGRQRAVEEFGLGRMRERYADLYATLLQTRRGGF